MRSFLLSIASFLLIINFVSAQSKFGIEFKGSRVNTTNSGDLRSIYFGIPSYNITDEADLTVYAQSLGLTYRLNDKNLVKLHLGNHQNGRVLSGIGCNDTICTPYTASNVIYHYFQLAPSYAYRLLNKKIIIPIEAGININVTTQEPSNFVVPINKFNFDYELSTGVDYKLDPNLIIGLHVLYTANINEYQDKETVDGTYKPKQLGVEFSIQYEFSEAANN